MIAQSPSHPPQSPWYKQQYSMKQSTSGKSEATEINESEIGQLCDGNHHTDEILTEISFSDKQNE